MEWFFKTFGKGLLYFLLSPLLLLFLLIYGIGLFFYMLFLLIKSIIYFFRGKPVFDKIKEDIIADEIIASNLENGPIKKEAPTLNLTYNNINLNANPVNTENEIKSINEIKEIEISDAFISELGENDVREDE